MNKKICAFFVALLLIFSFVEGSRVPVEGASRRQRERERREQREREEQQERREQRRRREEPRRGGDRNEETRRGGDRNEEPRRDGRKREDESEPAQVGLSGAASEVVRIANAERSKARLSDLRVDNELTAAAAKRAAELQRLFEHRRPDGRSWDTVLSECGVKRYNSWGENILYNSSGKAADAMTWWMKSQGHRDNILNRNYTHIGVGVYQSGGKTYFVQLFVGR
ncbi:hypothetical protein FACS1894187_22890 [Synergistales bacterium]|nr:hypothetical protein FACS1894187_22890 [Synergistales bacterium]